MISTDVLMAGDPWKPAEKTIPAAAIDQSTACSATDHAGLWGWKSTVRKGE